LIRYVRRTSSEFPRSKLRGIYQSSYGEKLYCTLIMLMIPDVAPNDIARHLVAPGCPICVDHLTHLRPNAT
jgi:hypothetical protein